MAPVIMHKATSYAKFMSHPKLSMFIANDFFDFSMLISEKYIKFKKTKTELIAFPIKPDLFQCSLN
jgi:hypothetical protein